MKSCYLIAASPRTGGNWLCSELYRAGLGRPGEFLNWLLDSDASMVELRKLWPKYAVNGLYGVKVHWTPEFDLLDLDDVLPPVRHRAFFHLVRQDRLAQISSLAIARRYGNWFTPAPPTPSVGLTSDELDEAQHDLAVIWTGWDAWFARYGIQPMMISYEQMFNDMGAVIERIRGHLEAAEWEPA